MPLSTRYRACPDLITCPGDGSDVSVPPPCPLIVYDPAYPKVAFTGVVEERSCLVTALVAGGGAPDPAPDEPRDRNAPAAQAMPAPAASTTSTSTTAIAGWRR